jgi:hypothetical protein
MARPSGRETCSQAPRFTKRALATIVPRRASRWFARYETTPVLIEICIGLEINGYLPADHMSVTAG